MKTTVEISDQLLIRAKRHAAKCGKPLRALIEEGLRRALEEPVTANRYSLPDRSAGKAGAADPLDSLSWQDLRDEIYAGR